MEEIKVTVIIPCYNQGIFLKDAVDSVMKSKYRNVEIIIVDDGSTDERTTDILRHYSPSIARVIHTSNQGLPSARNTGIEEANGEYILPLDADDRISSNYISEAVKVLDNNENVGIVYAKAKKFGLENKIWRLPPYNLRDMIAGNLIYASAFFRRKDWKRAGGYKKELNKGMEDWEFWLSLIEMGVEVVQLPNVHFYYRIRKASMARSSNIDHISENLQLIYFFHKELFDKYLPASLESYYKYRRVKADLRSVDVRLGRFFFAPIKYVVDKFIY